jgi:hypothetical protein
MPGDMIVYDPEKDGVRMRENPKDQVDSSQETVDRIEDAVG